MPTVGIGIGPNAIARRREPFVVPGTYVAPTVFAVGTLAAGTTSATPAIPAGYQDNDIIVIVVDTSNEPVNTPAGYTALTPFGVGTQGATSAARVSLFWKRASGTETNPTLTGTTVHVSSVIALIRGCPVGQDPIMQTVGGASGVATGTTMTFGTFSTTVDNVLIFQAVSRASAIVSGIYSNLANPNLTELTERFDGGTSLGGGIGIFTGLRAVAGSIGSTTVTSSQGGNTGRHTLAFRPTFVPTDPPFSYVRDGEVAYTTTPSGLVVATIASEPTLSPSVTYTTAPTGSAIGEIR